MTQSAWPRVTGACVTLTLAACGGLTGTDTVNPPAAFSGTVTSRSYTVGTAIETLTLPAAAGGEHSLIYSLEPDVPGLTFDPERRTLSGTPARAGHHRMTYTVAAAGDDAAGEAATLNFVISITLPLPGTWHFQPPVVATLQIEETMLTVTIGDGSSALGTTAPYDSITSAAVTGTLVFEDNALAFVLGAKPDSIEVVPATGVSASQAEQALAAVRELARVADNQPVVIRADGTSMTVKGAGITTLFQTVGVQATEQLTACRDSPCAKRETPDAPGPEDPGPEDPGPEDPGAPLPEDVAPRFTGSVQDRTYTVGEPIDPLTLPRASGGNGARTYSLGPALPAGLRFDAATRTVRGTPRAAGSYRLTYTVADSDDNTGVTDTDVLFFTIVVEEPTVAEPPAEDPPTEDPPAEDPPTEEPPAEDPQTPTSPSPPDYHGTWYLDFELDAPAIVGFGDRTFTLSIGDESAALHSDLPLSLVTKIAAGGTFSVESTTDSGVEIRLTVGTVTISPSVLTSFIAPSLQTAANDTVTLDVDGDSMTLSGNVVDNLGDNLGFDDTSLTACRDKACSS